MLQTDYNEDFIKMREIGRHASACLDILEWLIGPGISTQVMDDIVVKYAKDNNLICAPYGYKGFPKSCCTSVNHVVCHGIPSHKKILKDGDIVKVDITFKDQEGYHGDSCRTFAVGTPGVRANRLMKVTKNALQFGIEQCFAGNTVRDIGIAIQTYVEGEGFSTVKEYVGHGIGKNVFHGTPHIFHYYKPHKPEMDKVLEPGMTLTIEPMINAGKPETKVLKDGWTVVTKDKSLSAQFEHTIGINADGPATIFTE